MSENNGKKQVAIIWILTVLIIILIAIIVGLFIMVMKAKKQTNSEIKQEIKQIEYNTNIKQQEVNGLDNSEKNNIVANVNNKKEDETKKNLNDVNDVSNVQAIPTETAYTENE